MSDDKTKEIRELDSFIDKKSEKVVYEKKGLSKANIDNLIKKARKIGFFLGVMLSNIVLAITFGFFALKPKTVIGYVIEVSQLTGETRRVDNVVKEVYEYSMPEFVLANVVRTYIVNLRSVSNDGEVNKENVRKVYNYSTKNAIQFVRSYFENNNPIVRGKTERVKIDVINCQSISSEKKGGFKFLVDWNEVSYDLSSGMVKSDKDYRADIDIQQFKPNDITGKNNPVGVYITQISISEIENGYIKTRE